MHCVCLPHATCFDFFCLFHLAASPHPRFRLTISPPLCNCHAVLCGSAADQRVTQGAPASGKYRGMWHCFTSMLAEEGPRSFWSVHLRRNGHHTCGADVTHTRFRCHTHCAGVTHGTGVVQERASLTPPRVHRKGHTPAQILSLLYGVLQVCQRDVSSGILWHS